MQETSTVPRGGEIVYIVDEFTKLLLRAVERPHTKYVESIFSECTGLVKATHVDLAANINPSGGDAKDAQLAKTTNRKTGTDGQGSRKGGRDDDRDKVQSTDNNCIPPNL